MKTKQIQNFIKVFILNRFHLLNSSYMIPIERLQIYVNLDCPQI